MEKRTKTTDEWKIYHFSFDIQEAGKDYSKIRTKLFGNMKSKYGFRSFEEKQSKPFELLKVHCIYVNDSSYLILSRKSAWEVAEKLFSGFSDEEEEVYMRYVISDFTPDSPFRYGGDEEDRAVFYHWNHDLLIFAD